MRLTVMLHGYPPDGRPDLPADLPPAFLLTAVLQPGSYTRKSRLTDAQMLELFDRIEQGPEPVGGTYTDFTLTYFLNGIQVHCEGWQQALMPGGDRNVVRPSGQLLRRTFGYDFDKPTYYFG
jgi:hypothetical protein